MPGHHGRDLFVGEGQRIALIPPLLPSLQPALAPSLQALLHSHPGELPCSRAGAARGCRAPNTTRFFLFVPFAKSIYGVFPEETSQ